MNNIKKFAQEYKFSKPKQESVSDFVCRVKPLQESESPLEIQVSRESSGQWLLDEVCERFGGIQEKDYFGLRYSDKDKQRQWLDLGRNVYQQLKDTHPIVVSFRVKHYPASPLEDLRQDLACYFLYLQLRRDLFSGRLLGKSSDLYQLAAYAVQGDIGDYDFQNDETRYLADKKLLPNLNAKTEAKIIDIHKTLNGLSDADAELKFLEKASQLDTYGVEPFYVKDQKGNNLYVGLTHEGVSTFQGSRRAHLFKWIDIAKIHYQGKLFIIHVFLDEVLNNQQFKKKHVLGFKCESGFAAEALWKWANDRMCFFSLSRSSEAKRVKSGGGIFRKRKTFKFAGRCRKEIQQLSMSTMCINTIDMNGLSRRNTLAKTDTLSGDDIDRAGRFNTMPSREKGKMLGTQDTLDSLFLGPQHGSIENNTLNSIDSPKLPDQRSFQSTTTQSLENIAEETILSTVEQQDQYAQEDHKSEASKSSSCLSSLQNLNVPPNDVKQRRLSEGHADIAGALQQLQNAVTVAVDHEFNKVVKKGRMCWCLCHCLCVSCLLALTLILFAMVAILLTILLLHYRTESGSYDYSGFLSDIFQNPEKAARLMRSNHITSVARDGYSAFYNYVRSFSPEN